MELPNWIDEDIIHGIGFWLLTLGTMIAFLLGFKGAESGLFGLVAAGDDSFKIALGTKVLLMLLTPVVAYMVALKFFR